MRFCLQDFKRETKNTSHDFHGLVTWGYVIFWVGPSFICRFHEFFHQRSIWGLEKANVSFCYSYQLSTSHQRCFKKTDLWILVNWEEFILSRAYACILKQQYLEKQNVLFKLFCLLQSQISSRHLFLLMETPHSHFLTENLLCICQSNSTSIRTPERNFLPLS